MVVDASVAAKWFFPESGHERARELLAGEDTLVAPSLIFAEVASVVWKRHRRGEVTRADADAIIPLMARLFSDVAPLEALATRALALALDHEHPVYDCFYLALAERERAPIASADHRLEALADRAGIEVRSFR